PTPSGLPTHPQRPGDVPLDPKEESRSGRLAEKALYCALEELRIAFSERQPPAAPILYARPPGAPAPRRPKRKAPVSGRSRVCIFSQKRIFHPPFRTASRKAGP